MALTTLLFLTVYLICLLGCMFYHPVLGVIGYVITYVVAPSSQWWGVDLATMGMRYSFFMAVALALGVILQSRKLMFPGKLYGQEVLFLLLVGWVFVSSYVGLPGYMGDNFAIKLFKVAIFLWMLIRIVDSQANYEVFLWTLVLTSAYVGFDALGVSTAQFGRIDRGVGGSDFAEGNFLATHFAMVLPFIGVFFMKGSKKQKIILLVAGVLLVNGIVLCRSRGVFVALGAGVFSAIFWAPKVWRNKVIALVIVGMIGSFFLVDKGFVERMGRINLNVVNLEEQDDSTVGRIMAWKAALAMAKNHTLGIGQGNFSHHVGYYQPAIPGKDAHNTYLRALAELGLPGVFLIGAMIWNAFRTLREQKRRIEFHELPHDLLLHVYAQSVALVIFLAAGMFITETYIEEFYWLLMFPVLLARVVDRAMVVQEEKSNLLIDEDRNLAEKIVKAGSL
jgi:O-antigen ligase